MKRFYDMWWFFCLIFNIQLSRYRQSLAISLGICECDFHGKTGLRNVTQLIIFRINHLCFSDFQVGPESDDKCQWQTREEKPHIEGKVWEDKVNLRSYSPLSLQGTQSDQYFSAWTSATLISKTPTLKKKKLGVGDSHGKKNSTYLKRQNLLPWIQTDTYKDVNPNSKFRTCRGSLFIFI